MNSTKTRGTPDKKRRAKNARGIAEGLAKMKKARLNRVKRPPYDPKRHGSFEEWAGPDGLKRLTNILRNREEIKRRATVANRAAHSHILRRAVTIAKLYGRHRLADRLEEFAVNLEAEDERIGGWNE